MRKQSQIYHLVEQEPIHRLLAQGRWARKHLDQEELDQGASSALDEEEYVWNQVTLDSQQETSKQC